MSTAITIPKSEFDDLKADVNRLKSVVAGLIKRDKKLAKVISSEDIPDRDPTSEEWMLQASRVFNVTSKYNPDDDLADMTKLKPVDWSGYA